MQTCKNEDLNSLSIPSSSHLAPSDHYLLPEMRELSGHLNSDDCIIAVADLFLNVKDPDFYKK